MDIKTLEPYFYSNGKKYVFPCEIYIKRNENGTPCECNSLNYLKQVMNQLAKFYGWKEHDRAVSDEFEINFKISSVGIYDVSEFGWTVPVDVDETLLIFMITNLAMKYKWKVIED